MPPRSLPPAVDLHASQRTRSNAPPPPPSPPLLPWQFGEIVFPFFPIFHPGGYVYRFIQGKEGKSFDLEEPAFINAVCDLMQNQRICTMFNAADTDGSGGLSRDVRCSQ